MKGPLRRAGELAGAPMHFFQTPLPTKRPEGPRRPFLSQAVGSASSCVQNPRLGSPEPFH